MSARRFISTALCALLLAGGASTRAPAQAQEARPDPRKLELQRVRKDIGESRRQQEQLARERAALQAEIDKISARLVELARRAQQLEAKIAENDARIERLVREQAYIRARLASNHKTTVRLVAALQRLQQDPPPPFVTSASDVLAAVRSAMMLGHVVPRMDARAKALRRDLLQLASVRRQLEFERAQREENLKRLNETSSSMEGLLRLKKDLLARTERELTEEQKRMAALQRKAKTLEQLLNALERQARREEEAERRAREEQQKQASAPESTPESAPAPTPAPAPEKRKAPPITSLKGRLPWPAQGRVLVRYGQKTELFGRARGVYLMTLPGAVVAAPAAGKVRAAGPYRSYGHIVYLDLGQGYRILLAGMEKTVVNRGEKVRAGEPLGIMGARAMPATVPERRFEGGRPILYLEFRRGKKTLNPGPWWLGGRQARK